MLKKIAFSATNLKLKLKKPKQKGLESKSCSKLSECQNNVSSIRSVNEINLKSSKSLKSIIKNNIYKNKKSNLKTLPSEATIKKTHIEILPSKERVLELDLNTTKNIDSFNQNDILKIENKIEELKQTMSINFKMLQDRGFKLEDLQASSEKLNESCQDLRAVSQKTKQIFIKNGCKRNFIFISYICLVLLNLFTILYFISNK